MGLKQSLILMNMTLSVIRIFRLIFGFFVPSFTKLYHPVLQIIIFHSDLILNFIHLRIKLMQKICMVCVLLMILIIELSLADTRRMRI